MSAEESISVPAAAPKSQRPARYWRESYEILSFELTSDYEAVFVDRDGGEKFAKPVDAIALCRVTSRQYDQKGEKTGKVRDQGTSLHGWVFEPDGCDEIVDTNDNFICLRRVAQAP